MTNKPKRRYRIRNWRDYNSALVRRGSLTLWVEVGVVGRWCDTASPVRRGRRRLYSDLAVTCALTLREVYHLPLRFTQGLVRSVLRLLGTDLPAPHYSTLSRRAASLEVKLARLGKEPLHLAVDSTGLKLYGEGEWKVRLHGKEKRRTWRKLHLLVDHRTHESVALEMTDKDVLDRHALPGLLRGVAGEVAEVLGDGAYDFQDCYKAIHALGARSVIPPQVRARVRSGSEFRDRNAAVLRGREVGRDEWKKEAGYHRRRQLIAASQRLEEFNSDLSLTVLELKAAADQSVAFGSGVEGFHTIANALGLIAEKGELTSRTLLKLQTQGVHTTKYLAEGLGLSEQQVKKLIAENRLRGDVAARIIAEGIEAHKGGAAERIINGTLYGQRAQFENNVEELAAQGTRHVSGAIRDSYHLGNTLLTSSQAQQTVQFIDRAAGSLLKMVDTAVHVGKDATAGLIEGMLNPDGLVAGVGNFVGTFTKALRGPLGFDSHSPARKMIPVGEDAAEGVVVGFEGYMQGEGVRRLSAAVTATVAQTRNRRRMQDLFEREPDFLPKLKRQAGARGINPDHLLNLMALETSGTFNPAITNPWGYTGLIQFGTDAARDLGTSTRALRGMSATAQLDYVFRYLDQHAHDARGNRVALDTQAKLYAAVGAGHAERDDSATFFRAGTKGFRNNPSWNVNGDGLIQQWELGAAAAAKLGAGVNFTVNDAPISAANPVPVVVAGDLTGGVGMFAALQSHAGPVARDFGAQVAPLATAVASLEIPVEEVRLGMQEFAVMLPQAATNSGIGLALLEQETLRAAEGTSAYSKSQAEYRKAAIIGVDAMTRAAGALGQIAGLLPTGGGQVGKKRGFFSKLLGFAAPFLSFLPGGQVLSALAGMGSAALAGNWAGVAAGAAAGFSSGGAFRSRSSGPAPALGDVSMGQGNVGTTVNNSPP